MSLSRPSGLAQSAQASSAGAPASPTTGSASKKMKEQSRGSGDSVGPSAAASFPAQSGPSTMNPTLRQPILASKPQIHHSNHQVRSPSPVSKLLQITGRNLGTPRRHQRNQRQESKQQEHPPAASPTANQAATLPTKSPTAFTSMPVASSTQQRSWVDVVRRSATTSEEIHMNPGASTRFESFSSSRMVQNEKSSPSSAARCSLEKIQSSEPGFKLGDGDLQHQTDDSGVYLKLLNTSSLPSTPKFQNRLEQSRAFKSWAQGRCYRCLAHGHQVRSCRDSFRCILCRCPGHRARFCHLRITPSSSRDHYQEDLQCTQSIQSFQQPKSLQLHTHRSSRCEADTKFLHHYPVSKVASGCSSQGHRSEPSKLPTSTDEKDMNNAWWSYQWLASLASTTSLDSKSTPLLDVLRSELERLLESHLERMLQPIREELSTIKVWLPRVATLANCGGQENKCVPDGSALNTAELFGPFSPLRLSSTSTILDSLAAAHKSVDRLAAEPPMTICQETPLEQNVEVSKEKSVAPVPLDPQENNMLKQTVGQVEDSILVEDALDKKTVSHADMTVISSSDGGQVQPIVEVMVEESQASDVSLMKTSSSLDNFTTKRDVLSSSRKVTTTGRKDEDSTNSTPPIKAARGRRQLYVKSLFHRNTHPAQRNILKELGFIQKDGNLDGSKLDIFADVMKDLLPQELLISLMKLEGQAFWETMATILDTLF